MIRVDNLSIRFQDDVIVNGHIAIEDKKITAIIGESGSGKTTLLYALGLISSNDGYKYSFDGIDIDIKDDKQKALYRKNKIGYIFQDNNLINSLTVKANIQLCSEIAFQNISENEISKLLTFVRLSNYENKYPMNLSGGERQRLAIACALAKNPDLIIADEPTSSLDKKNEDMVLDILRDIAYKEGKKVVIATHNQRIYSEADFVYRIENHEIKEVKSTTKNCTDTIIESSVQTANLRFSFFNKLVKNLGHRRKFQLRLMVILSSISIALCSISFFFGDSFVSSQKAFMNMMSNREIFLINKTIPSTNDYDYDENLSISVDLVEKIKSISELEDIYPFHEIRSTGIDFINGSFIDGNSIIITKNNGEVEEYHFSMSAAPSYQISNATLNTENYVILPFFPEQKMDDKLQYSLGEVTSDSIFISSTLASYLNIKPSDSNVVLSVFPCIPVFQYDTVMTEYSDNGNSSQYNIDIDIGVQQQIDFPVAGIMRNDIINSYTSSGNNCIYIPYEQLNYIIDSTKSNNNEYNLNEFYSKELSSSAYVLYVKDYSVINIASQKLKKISPNFEVISRYQNIEAMNDNLNNVRKAMTTISIIILLIVFLLMSIISYNYVSQRKYEIAILKANGLTSNETRKIILIESLYQAIKTAIISSAVSLSLVLFSKMLFGSLIIDLNYYMLIVILVISFLSIVFPTILTISKISKFEPDRILRN